jgi:hypothetical protein
MLPRENPQRGAGARRRVAATWIIEEEDAARLERVMNRLYSERLKPGEMRDLAQTIDRVLDGLFSEDESAEDAT